MRIIWVKVGGLWPLTSGGRLRSFHLVSELSRRHEVIVITTHEIGEDPRLLAAQLPSCEAVFSVPFVAPKKGSLSFARALISSWLSPLPVDLWKWQVPALRRLLEEFLADGKPDVCVADFLAALPNLPLTGRPPTILFEHNVEHLIWKRLASLEGRWWLWGPLEVEWRKMRRFESRALCGVDLTLAVSGSDSKILSSSAPGARVSAIPTGVDTRYFAPTGTPETPGSLAFLGSMDWFPNEDAVLHFVEMILPRVKSEVPEATLTVVGRNPGVRLKAAALAAGVRLTGTVDDVRPYVAASSVVVVPLRAGGGTRLKIFEALAMGKAVVSTTVGAEGLPLEPGTHFLQADEPEAFARAVVSLLRDPGRRLDLGNAGRALVEARYSWAQVAQVFEDNCREVIHAHAS
jgi:glycosyltransferase involved in cell wall biosynthesis